MSQRAEQLERVQRSTDSLWYRNWIVSQQPDDAVAVNAMGNCLARQGRFAEAREQFDRAVSLATDDAEFLRNLAMAQLALDDLPAYRQSCDQLMRLVGDTTDREQAWLAVSPCLHERSQIGSRS